MNHFLIDCQFASRITSTHYEDLQREDARTRVDDGRRHRDTKNPNKIKATGRTCVRVFIVAPSLSDRVVFPAVFFCEPTTGVEVVEEVSEALELITVPPISKNK